MIAKITSATLVGLNCIPIHVDVAVQGSWPGFSIIGLGDTSIQESKERIRSTWKQAKLSFPGSKKITINLAPGNVKKTGTSFDFPMALGIYLADKKINSNIFKESFCVGELSLNGELRKIPGILPIIIFAKKNNYKSCFFPAKNIEEAALIQGIKLYPVQSFQEMIDHLNKKKLIPAYSKKRQKQKKTLLKKPFASICGNDFAKRALTIAAAGGHHILLTGPPGTGKSMLAKSLPNILPELAQEEIIELTSIYSITKNHTLSSLITTRPFRSPHHSASVQSILGGGANPMPGEITLAHKGVLYLDELPEFRKDVLEALRQPLEEKIITISRSKQTVEYPANFMLVASANPCPCGFFTDEDKNCICSTNTILRYRKKFSGPIMDRIDIVVNVPRIETHKLEAQIPKDHIDYQKLVLTAKRQQILRFKGTSRGNSNMKIDEIKKYCQLSTKTRNLLQQATDMYHLSPRSYFKILMIARTIADMSAEKNISLLHLAEAIQLNSQEKNSRLAA